MFKMQEYNNSEIEKILENDNYINWLDNFSKDHKYFANNSWGELYLGLPKSDINNASDISLFYTMLSEYCYSFKFAGYIDARGNDVKFPLKHDDNYYLIGMSSDMQANYCLRLKTGDDSFVDYEDMKKYYTNNNIKTLKKTGY